MTSSSNEQGWVTLIQTIHNGGVSYSSARPSPLIARRLQHRGRADERSQWQEVAESIRRTHNAGGRRLISILGALGTMKLQHQYRATDADYDLAQLPVCKRLTQRESKAQRGHCVALFGYRWGGPTHLRTALSLRLLSYATSTSPSSTSVFDAASTAQCITLRGTRTRHPSPDGH
jgi:hypothetical protein